MRGKKSAKGGKREMRKKCQVGELRGRGKNRSPRGRSLLTKEPKIYSRLMTREQSGNLQLKRSTIMSRVAMEQWIARLFAAQAARVRFPLSARAMCNIQMVFSLLV